MKYIILALLIMGLFNKLLDIDKQERYRRGEVDINKVKGEAKEAVDKVFNKYGL